MEETEKKEEDAKGTKRKEEDKSDTEKTKQVKKEKNAPSPDSDWLSTLSLGGGLAIALLTRWSADLLVHERKTCGGHRTVFQLARTQSRLASTDTPSKWAKAAPHSEEWNRLDDGFVCFQLHG